MSNIESCSMCCLFKLTGHSFLSVAFSRNGEYLTFGSDTIGVWRVSSGERIINFTDLSYSLKTVAFSPNGEYLASGSDDCIIGVCRISSGEQIKTLTGHSS